MRTDERTLLLKMFVCSTILKMVQQTMPFTCLFFCFLSFVFFNYTNSQ